MGKYFPETARQAKAQEFLELKQRVMTVMSGQDRRTSSTGYGLHGWDSPDHRERNRGCTEHSGRECW